jgi:hypothetical protein
MISTMTTKPDAARPRSSQRGLWANSNSVPLRLTGRLFEGGGMGMLSQFDHDSCRQRGQGMPIVRLAS